jgi:hypothetical protein
MKIWRKVLKEENGAALVWVLILFMMMMILVPSALLISRQDTLETVNQDNRIRAYYIALSGVDLGYAALMADISGSKYIEQFISDPTKRYDNQEVTVTDVGKALVSIDSVEIAGHRWIRITSVGHLDDSSMTATSIMRIRTDNFSFIMRESVTN